MGEEFPKATHTPEWQTDLQDDLTDDEQRQAAWATAEEDQMPFGRIQVDGSVEIVSIDAPDVRADREAFEASGLTPDKLPGIDDVLKDIEF